jgi:hypothetical protein
MILKSEELWQLDEDLSQEKNLAVLPGTLANIEHKKTSIARRAQAIRKEERPIPGSADADRREIDGVNQLRMNAINAIHSLGIV